MTAEVQDPMELADLHAASHAMWASIHGEENTLTSTVSPANEEIKENNDETEAKKQNPDEIQIVTCICGSEMMEITKKNKRIISCHVCSFQFHAQMSDSHYYYCPRGKEIPHKTGYALCITCSKSITKFTNGPVSDTHNREKLYFHTRAKTLFGCLKLRER
eukprot:584264_1